MTDWITKIEDNGTITHRGLSVIDVLEYHLKKGSVRPIKFGFELPRESLDNNSKTLRTHIEENLNKNNWIITLEEENND